MCEISIMQNVGTLPENGLFALALYLYMVNGHNMGYEYKLEIYNFKLFVNYVNCTYSCI